MKIRTSATEMPHLAPEPVEFAAAKAVWPDIEQRFTLPEDAAQNLYDWLDGPEYEEFKKSGEELSRYFISFVTGVKLRGRGEAVCAYPKLYRDALVPLQEAFDIADDPNAIVQYFTEHPVYYKVPGNNKDPFLFPKTLEPRDSISIAQCILNIKWWVYEPTVPGYWRVKEVADEKMRKLTDLYIEGTGDKSTRSLPQYARTSRSLGKDEKAIVKINAGYKITETYDPVTDDFVNMLMLVTWFFTDSKTNMRLFVDYFDISEGQDAAQERMHKSDMYLNWVSEFNPQQYANVCASYEVTTRKEEFLEDLVILKPERR